MKKIKYIFLLTAVSFVAFTGCKKQAQITGADGPTGATGVAGANLYATRISQNVDASDFPGAGPAYLYVYPFNNYNPNTNYALEVFAHKVQVEGGGAGTQNKLPWFNVYTPGDELLSAMHHDSIEIWYFSSAAWPSGQGDSLVNLEIMVFPKQ